VVILGGGHSAGGGHAVAARPNRSAVGIKVVGGRRDDVIGGRSSVGTRANASTVRGGTVPVANSRSFRNDPSGHGGWKHGRGDWKNTDTEPPGTEMAK